MDTKIQIKTNRNLSLTHICNLSADEFINIQEALYAAGKNGIALKIDRAVDSRFPSRALGGG